MHYLYVYENLDIDRSADQIYMEAYKQGLLLELVHHSELLQPGPHCFSKRDVGSSTGILYPRMLYIVVCCRSKTMMVRLVQTNKF